MQAFGQGTPSDTTESIDHGSCSQLEEESETDEGKARDKSQGQDHKDWFSSSTGNLITKARYYGA